VNPAIVLATARRVLLQLRHDPRTIALMLAVPCLLLVLLRYIYDDSPATFDRVGAPVLGIFPFVVMFVVTSVATLRERSTGTLERLLTMPMAKLDLLAGYALAFGAVAVLQSVLASALSLGLLGLDVRGDWPWLILVAVLDGVLGMALGLLVSAFATTEFQAVQFLPAFVLPQFLLCGLLVPRDQLPDFLHAVSAVLPLSYAVDAMRTITTDAGAGADVARDMVIVLVFAVVALAAGAATLRRRTA
jgi:ABC-2 type transport system permease protein